MRSTVQQAYDYGSWTTQMFGIASAFEGEIWKRLYFDGVCMCVCVTFAYMYHSCMVYRVSATHGYATAYKVHVLMLMCSILIYIYGHCFFNNTFPRSKSMLNSPHSPLSIISKVSLKDVKNKRSIKGSFV